MYFEQFYLGCLAHASYLLGSEGEAVVVDPQRDVDIYLNAAEEQGLKIRHIFETHLHADFVSGNLPYAPAQKSISALKPAPGFRMWTCTMASNCASARRTSPSWKRRDTRRKASVCSSPTKRNLRGPGRC